MITKHFPCEKEMDEVFHSCKEMKTFREILCRAELLKNTAGEEARLEEGVVCSRSKPGITCQKSGFEHLRNYLQNPGLRRKSDPE